MDIHVVRQGESLYAIAQAYGTTAARLAQDNELAPPYRLAVGQTIVILYPRQVYTVTAGDTLDSIAEQYGVTVNQLLRNNPQLNGLPAITPGQVLVIDYAQEKQGDMAVNGYAYPYIDRQVLRKTLPYLTYLTLFTYGITPEGGLVGIDDEEVIAIAREYGVAPLMLISTLTNEGNFNNELSSAVVNNPAIQERLINETLVTLREKGYYGLDIDFEFVRPEDRDAYTTFIRNVRERLNAEGFIVVAALAPKTDSAQPGLLYQGHDYAGIAAAANYVLLMTYEWGYTYGPPMAVAPIDKVREVLDYAVTQMPADKIFMGIPNYGYDWTLPFIRGESQARSLSNVAAVEQAVVRNAAISFDPVAQAPFYGYFDEQGREHEVWFEDARSVNAKLALIPEYGFEGGSYWTVMKYFPQNWLVLNSLYNIRKVL
ncbi:MAG TPA: LysM peptidoglycan-binding domain-containing protein [Firmicutes bacterium]|nr:LysM peptidoglycan-binding domain-containing protein [Bacillota bacterium]